MNRRVGYREQGKKKKGYSNSPAKPGFAINPEQM